MNDVASRSSVWATIALVVLALSILGRAETSLAEETQEAKRPRVLLHDLAPLLPTQDGSTPSKGTAVVDGPLSQTAHALSMELCRALSKRSDYRILCAEDVRQLVNLGSLATSFDGTCGERCQSQLAQAVKADWIVVGTIAIARSSSGFDVSLSSLAASDGKELVHLSLHGASVEAFAPSIKDAADALLPKVLPKAGGETQTSHKP